MPNIRMVEGDSIHGATSMNESSMLSFSLYKYQIILLLNNGSPRKSLLISTFQHKSPFHFIDLLILTTISSLQSQQKVTSLSFRFLFRFEVILHEN